MATSTVYHLNNRTDPKRKPGRPRKVLQMASTTVTPITTNETAAVEAAKPTSKITQKTGFDLATFSDVLLKKTYTVPSDVTSVEEALAAVGNDSSALIKVINDGLKAHSQEVANSDPTGWFTTDDDGDITTVAYTGTLADGKMGKAINAVILNWAKMNAGGDFKNAEQKKDLKAKAEQFFRDNPAMLTGIVDAASK